MGPEIVSGWEQVGSWLPEEQDEGRLEGWNFQPHIPDLLGGERCWGLGQPLNG